MGEWDVVSTAPAQGGGEWDVVSTAPVRRRGGRRGPRNPNGNPTTPPPAPRPQPRPAAPARPSSALRQFGQGAQDTILTGLGAMLNPNEMGAAALRGVAAGAQEASDRTGSPGAARVANWLNRQTNALAPTTADSARRVALNEPAPANALQRGAYIAGGVAPTLGIPGGALPGALSGVGMFAAGEGARRGGANDFEAGIAQLGGGLAGGVAGVAIPRAVPRMAPPPVDMPAARAAAIESLPPNLRTLPPGADAALTADLRANTRPTDAAVRALNNSLPEPIPMSRGQVSGLPEQQAVENSYRAGASGRGPAELAQAQRQSAEEAILANLNRFGEQVAGGPVPARGDGGAAISERLNAMYDAERGRTNAAYDAAREQVNGAMLPQSEIPNFAATLRDSVSDYVPELTPGTRSVLNSVDGLSTFGARDLFNLRERLAIIRRTGSDADAAAAARATSALDGYVDTANNSGLFTGEPQAVAAWRDAIAQRRNQGNLFESNDRVSDLTARTQRSGERTTNVAPEDAGNRVFGTGNSWINKANLARDLRRMQEVVGRDSQEWAALRGEHFRRLMDAGSGPLEGGAPTFSGRNFANAWRDARARAMPTLRALYSAEEIAALDRLAFLADRTTTPVTGGRNTSATATTAKALSREALRRTLGRIPFAGGLIDALLTAPDTVNASRMFNNPAPNRGAPRVPRPRSNPLTYRDALTVVGPNALAGAPRPND